MGTLKGVSCVTDERVQMQMAFQPEVVRADTICAALGGSQESGRATEMKERRLRASTKRHSMLSYMGCEM